MQKSMNNKQYSLVHIGPIEFEVYAFKGVCLGLGFLPNPDSRRMSRLLTSLGPDTVPTTSTDVPQRRQSSRGHS